MGAPVWPHMHKPPPIGGPTSDQRCHLQLEVPPPIGGPTSWSYFFVPSGVITILDYIKNKIINNNETDHNRVATLFSNDLWSEVSPPIGGPTSWSYFFVPSGVITILDYIKNKIINNNETDHNRVATLFSNDICSNLGPILATGPAPAPRNNSN